MLKVKLRAGEGKGRERPNFWCSLTSHFDLLGVGDVFIKKTERRSLAIPSSS